MRPSSLIYTLVGVLIFASYQILNQPRFPNLPPDQSDVSRQSKSDPPSTYKDESRLPDVVPANLTDESTPKDEAQLDGKLPATNQSSETAKDEAQLDGKLPATNQSSETAEDEAQLDGKLPATNQSSETAKDEAQPDGNLLATNQSSDPRAAKKNLSYLADYAYSEVPPETKPADTVLKSLEDIPRGTPVEEIKRVADAFGMDFNFMKAVAKIESDFNPKQRTGS